MKRDIRTKREREKAMVSEMIALYCRKQHGGLAAFCFARSSERLHKWFINTKLYKNNLESYVKGQGMTRKTKIRIMATVTLLMSVGFIMMDQVPVGRVVLACVWVFHILYFCFKVKTIKPDYSET